MLYAPLVIDLAKFQASHSDWEGRPLKADGVLGARTQWALDVACLDPRRQAIIQRACSAVGHVEQSSNRSAMIDAWLARCGAPLGSPWCAAFASWCCSVDGLDELKEASAQSLGRRLRASTLVTPGDVAWFATGPTTGHCGIVVGLGAGEVAVVEGNHRDRVAIVRRSLLQVHVATPLPVQEMPAVPPGLVMIAAGIAGTR